MQINLDLIKPSPRPVRTSWDEDKMNELAQSIKEQGIIVPVKVRPTGNEYELVYGHRRVEAARRARLTEIPAIVEGVDDTDALVQALIENVQREDMEPMDTALSLKAIKEETGWSNMDLERRGIMSNTHASRLLLLLEEDKETQSMIARGETSRGAPKGKVTPFHVAEVRATTRDPALKKSILKKAAREGLTQPQTRRVAESVAAAPSEEAKKKILEWEYSPTLHNPERIKRRAQEYGAHDRFYQDPKPQQDDQWKRAPEVSAIIDGLREQRRLLAEYRKTAQVGKMAPEARQFIARRVRNYADALLNWANVLEGSDAE